MWPSGDKWSRGGDGIREVCSGAFTCLGCFVYYYYFENLEHSVCAQLQPPGPCLSVFLQRAQPHGRISGPCRCLAIMTGQLRPLGGRILDIFPGVPRGIAPTVTLCGNGLHTHFFVEVSISSCEINPLKWTIPWHLAHSQCHANRTPV